MILSKICITKKSMHIAYSKSCKSVLKKKPHWIMWFSFGDIQSPFANSELQKFVSCFSDWPYNNFVCEFWQPWHFTITNLNLRMLGGCFCSVLAVLVFLYWYAVAVHLIPPHLVTLRRLNWTDMFFASSGRCFPRGHVLFIFCHS